MEDIPEPKHRQRKKKLINEVREALEFYFSPANIGKDKFMQNLLDVDPYIDIEIFNKFNKIKNLTTVTKILQKAVKKSDILELSEDGLKVKRSSPVEMKEDEMECTIYVENLPPNSTHEWLQKVFSLYGVIDYISLPKFQQSGRPKGFAFVEFGTPQEAQKALEAFGGLASLDGTLNPSELMTIRTYGKIDDDVTVESESLCPDKNCEDEEKNISEKSNSPLLEKECKESEKRSFKDAFGKKESDSEAPSKKTKLSSEEEGSKKKKKKRRRNKKEKEYELESVYLRVMSKKDWKTLRNKYLNTQKEIMKQLKQTVRYQNSYADNSYAVEKSVKTNKPTYNPDVIVKITLKEPPQDLKEFREGVTNGRNTIAYVDSSSENKEVYVRFKFSDDAKKFVKEGLWDSVQLLKGDEELAYWTKLSTSWDLKRPKKRGNGNSKISSECRGREKLINRALKLKSNENARIIFNDD